MKRIFALIMALLCCLPCLAFAQESTQSQEWVKDGLTVIRNHSVTDTTAVDYPTFETPNQALASFLEQNITAPILTLCKAQDGVLTRSGFTASMDFPGILSVEASVTQVTNSGDALPTQFFSMLVDVQKLAVLSLSDLFLQTEEECIWLINEAVLTKAKDLLSADMQSPEFLPKPSSVYVFSDGLRVLYAADTLTASDMAIDLPWEDLELSQSYYLTGVTPSPAPTQTPAPSPTPAPTQTINLDNTLAPVVTTTPMPLQASDEIMADVLQRGLWKELGSDGSTYYQFMPDGTMLTVSVSGYTVQDGVLTADAMTGTLDMGSESAFTLYEQDGSLSGYVLNRAGDSVAPEEFVTPTPSPLPTATPSPSPTPSPVPSSTPVPTLVPTASPAPTPGPTPTLSPFERAMEEAPVISAQTVTFEKRNQLEVYSAPTSEAYRLSGAQVTTGSDVTIYGVEGDWTLVSYLIGNGSKGRMGYIENAPLADPDNTPQLSFVRIDLPIVTDADATDDPLQGKGVITTLKAGDTVTLLALMDGQWAYVETEHEGKVCRLFIPQSAFMQEGA